MLALALVWFSSLPMATGQSCWAGRKGLVMPRSNAGGGAPVGSLAVRERGLDHACLWLSVCVQAPWLYMIETDYVWMKPLVPPQAEDVNVASIAFPFGYIQVCMGRGQACLHGRR